MAHTSPHGLVSLDSISLRFVYGFLCLSGIHIDGDSRGRLHFKRTTRAGREWPPEAHCASCVQIPLLLSAGAWPSIILLPTHAGRSMDQRVSIVEVRREEERDAALQHASGHEMGSKTARRCAAPQSALTRYTLLEIERIEPRAAPEGAGRGARGTTEQGSQAVRSARCPRTGASLQTPTAAPEAWPRAGTRWRSGPPRWHTWEAQ